MTEGAGDPPAGQQADQRHAGLEDPEDDPDPDPGCPRRTGQPDADGRAEVPEAYGDRGEEQG